MLRSKLVVQSKTNVNVAKVLRRDHPVLPSKIHRKPIRRKILPQEGNSTNDETIVSSVSSTNSTDSNEQEVYYIIRVPPVLTQFDNRSSETPCLVKLSENSSVPNNDNFYHRSTSTLVSMIPALSGDVGLSVNEKKISRRDGTNYDKPVSKKNQPTSMKKINLENLHATEKDNRRHWRLFRKMCPFCSNCCCLVSFIAVLLLLVAIAALLVYLLTKHATTTTTTTTTTTSVTTTTSTTSTTTTTTSTSTSTSSTSSTSTSTSTSTTTTATMTTTTTPTPPCVPTSVGSASTLYSTSSGANTVYTCFAYEWTSPTTGPVKLAFQLRHDPDLWYVDDVSVYAGGTQMLTNGGFENALLSPWVVSNPNGPCSGSAGHVSSSSCRSGSQCFSDGSNGCADQVAQQFTATAGQLYLVSFWLKSGNTGSVITALVTLS
ncbi:unnamed protein product [Adineta ricciae]|uniref:Uncharacterized protein n=1 Tax=Adineta ricciae TaxID=249248 RepID=A0A815BJ35_ADIRI|nr:unnamed protein product [Adineta ricciae]